MNRPETNNLTPAIQQAVLALLRSALWGQERFPFAPEPDTDWQAVYAELQHQTIQHLPVDLLAAADPANTMQYIQNLSGNIRKWHRILECQQLLTELFAQEGIRCVVLKGAAAARYYPMPEYRCMGDIDLLVLPEDFDRALALLQPTWEILSSNPRHVEMRHNRIVLELHKKFSNFHSPDLCQYLDSTIFADIPHAQTVSLERFSFPCLPRKSNGLVLLTHINSHMEFGLGFRQMVDWMMYVDRELDDTFWQTEFSAAARQLGLEKLALTVTRMCQLYLGLREDITWCHSADEALCAELLEHTFRQGNFGRRMPSKVNQAIGVISNTKKFRTFFREMQLRGLRNWPAVAKHPGLRPFAWLYQVFRYIRLGLQQEHPIRFLRHTLSSVKQQSSLLDRLEVTRMNNDH